ncbi:hypothetical protein ACFLW0_07685, partial [Chloroflexota bacterium]
YETVVSHHGETHEAWKHEQSKLGLSLTRVVEDSPINTDAQEIAKLAGLDMIINCIANRWGETVSIFAGAFEPTYKAAAKEAESHYIATNTRDNDIVIANACYKAAEFSIGLTNALPAVNSQGGDVVMIINSPSGQVVHYLFDSFGKTISGSIPRSVTVPPHIKNVIIYTEYPEAKLLDRFTNLDKVLLTSDWKQVIQTLEKSHGNGAKVAVYPNADIVYFSD